MPLLSNYPLAQSIGKWDLHCDGQFEQDQAEISLAKSVSNGFTDLLIKHKITRVTQREVNAVCRQKELVEYQWRKLRFNRREYR